MATFDPTAHHREHVTDPLDRADSYALLDDHVIRVVELCMICDGPYGECNCYHEPEPFDVRERRMSRRHGWDK